MTMALTVAINTNILAAPTSSDSLKQTQDNKKEIQAKVQKLDTEIDAVLKKIDSNKNDMNKIAQDIKTTQVKLASVEKDSKVQQDLFKKRVRAMYMSGVDSYLEVILKSEDLNDFMGRVDMISKVVAFDKGIVNKLKEQKDSISKQNENLNSQNNKLVSLKTSNENTLSKLSKDIKEQKELLSKVTEKEKQLLASEAAKVVASNSTSSKGGTLSRGASKSISYSKAMTMEATAYSGDGITASGTATKRNADSYSTIAVDPRIIPLGSTVYVEGYGYAIAEDTGGAIKGNIIDVFFPSESEARSWGRRSVKVYIVNN